VTRRASTTFQARFRIARPASIGHGDDKGSREADFPGKSGAKPFQYFQTENEGLYRIIFKTIKELGYFFLERGKKCPVEKEKRPHTSSNKSGRVWRLF
jgi:hypothetical protein